MALRVVRRVRLRATLVKPPMSKVAWSAVAKPLAGRVALVMGSEGEGISRLVLEKCDFACKLPQRGRVESLNVAQACTVMCYEWLRREMCGEGTRGV